jgi:hypothetical protein
MSERWKESHPARVGLLRANRRDEMLRIAANIAKLPHPLLQSIPQCYSEAIPKRIAVAMKAE